MSMQLIQCFARSKPIPTEKKLDFIWLFWVCCKKARNVSKFGFKKAKLANLCWDWFIKWWFTWKQVRGNK